MSESTRETLKRLLRLCDDLDNVKREADRLKADIIRRIETEERTLFEQESPPSVPLNRQRARREKPRP
jgi:hypothetical protein